jgi:hypothetical protein
VTKKVPRSQIAVGSLDTSDRGAGGCCVRWPSPRTACSWGGFDRVRLCCVRPIVRAPRALPRGRGKAPSALRCDRRRERAHRCASPSAAACRGGQAARACILPYQGRVGEVYFLPPVALRSRSTGPPWCDDSSFRELHLGKGVARVASGSVALNCYVYEPLPFTRTSPLSRTAGGSMDRPDCHFGASSQI